MSEEAWKAALRNSTAKYEALQEAWKTHDSAKILVAINEYKEAECQREVAEVNAGYWPAWPPKTDQGRKKYGLTLDQVNEIIYKMS
jgi:hypothetical protein